MKNPFNFLKKELPPIIEENKLPKPIHIHDWEVVSKTYASPVRVEGNVQINQQADKDLLEKTLFGVTVILWQCLICKDFRKEEMLGSDENTLDELINKIEAYGPQFVERDGNKTYVIAKYTVSPPPLGNIPVR